MNDWKELNLNIMEGICRALANESFIIFSPITLDHAEGQSQSLNVRGKVLCICFFELPWWLSGKRIYLQCRSRVQSLGWEDPVERLLLSDKTPGFLASGGDEFNPGPETRLDRSELLCNKVL